MTDHIDRAAETMCEHRLAPIPDAPDPRCRVAACFECQRKAARLDEGGLLAFPERDAEVAAKVLRIVETVCMTTDGDHLDGESEIPVGEVMRMILEAEEAFGIEREAGESDGDT